MVVPESILAVTSWKEIQMRILLYDVIKVTVKVFYNLKIRENQSVINTINHLEHNLIRNADNKPEMT